MAARAQAEAPMVLLLHGGGWRSGDPRSMVAHKQDFEAHGYCRHAGRRPVRAHAGTRPHPRDVCVSPDVPPAD